MKPKGTSKHTGRKRANDYIDLFICKSSPKQAAMFEHIIDERLSLRTLRIQDADELFAVVGANRAYLKQWLPWLDANTAPEHTRAFIQSILDQCARNEGFVCAILYERKIVGTAGYHPIKWNNRSVEIGYWLAEALAGHGIVTQCCRVLIEHAFTDLKLHKVLIPVAEENHKSRAIPERLGFKNKGVLRNAEWLYDRYVNHIIYSLSSQDWNRKITTANSLKFPLPHDSAKMSA